VALSDGETGNGPRSWEAQTTHQAETEIPARPSLYDRLGGVYNIPPVIDDLIDRIMVDSRLNADPRVDEAHHRVSAAGFKYFVIEMLCEAAGGPSATPLGRWETPTGTS
jgi:hypothetical protein